MVKNPPANAGDRRRFDSWVRKIPPEEDMAAYSSILAWRILWKSSLVGYSPWGHKELDMTEAN